MFRPAARFQSSQGFTIIELLLVMGILGTLFGLTTIDLSNLLPRANLRSAAEKLQVDLREQQLKAMVGETEGTTAATAYGVHFENSSYTLFPGDTYSATESANVVINIGNEFQIATTLASQIVVFERVSGEVLNYDSANDIISLTNSANGEVSQLELNKLGVVTITN